MKLLTTLLKGLVATALVVGALGGGAYAALVVDHHGGSSAAAADPTVSTTTEPSVPAETPATEAPAPAPVALAPGDRGEQVRELQARLFQLDWLPETTTGRYDAATAEAVRGFQSRRGLPATGRVRTTGGK